MKRSMVLKMMKMAMQKKWKTQMKLSRISRTKKSQLKYPISNESSMY